MPFFSPCTRKKNGRVRHFVLEVFFAASSAFPEEARETRPCNSDKVPRNALVSRVFARRVKLSAGKVRLAVHPRVKQDSFFHLRLNFRLLDLLASPLFARHPDGKRDGAAIVFHAGRRDFFTGHAIGSIPTIILIQSGEGD